MKFSIVARSSTWHTDKLVEQGKLRGLEVEVVNLRSLNGWQKMIDDLGDVVLWRSSSLPMPLHRSIMMQRVDKNKYLFNRSLAYDTLLAHKLYQQKSINPLKTITGIPTYAFPSLNQLLRSIKASYLSYPIVMKKNLSARGEGVYLLKDEEEVRALKIDWKEYLFQNFIENDGDVRVLVLGGVALGAMKRTKGAGNWKNNISQGGEGVDASTLFDTTDLRNKALSIASKFGLAFAGVDFIFDKKEQVWRFMEVNTVPQWQGFAAATGVDVTNKILDYVEQMGRKKSLKEKIENYYLTFESGLRRADQFHLYSRLYLTKEDRQAKEKLLKLKDWYLGNDEQGLGKRLEGMMQNRDGDELEPKTDRKKIYRKYPNILPWQNLLFWWLMAKNIYSEDVRLVVKQKATDEQLRRLANEILADEQAVHILSSGAINYLYLVEAYLGDSAKPDWLYKIHQAHTKSDSKDLVKRSFYFLTHLIIAGSHFYTRDLPSDEVYLKAFGDAEKLVKDNFFDCSLDMKLELLICARLVGKESSVEKMILSEAKRSKSNLGNFLVDTHNAWKHGFGHKLGRGEHRNCLYLML